MQIVTKMDKIVMKDYYYHITIMVENVNWMKLKHLLPK